VIGSSISFVYFFGLLINTVLPLFGYSRPLSALPILISFDLFVIICSALIVFRNNPIVFLLQKSDINNSDKMLLIFPILLPALTIFSIYLLNSTENSIPLILTLIMLTVYLAGVAYKQRKVTLHIYPVILFSIAFSLLSIYMLRYPLYGSDVHIEYGQVFLTTLDAQFWEPGKLTISNILSDTLLPTIFQSICNLDNLQCFYKFIFVFISLVTPLSIYCFSRKYVGDFYGFFAAFFSVIQLAYIWTVANPRTSVAVAFCALTLFVLFCDSLDKNQKGFFSMLFISSIIVSHYTTAYIFFFLLLLAAIGTFLLGKKIHFTKSISPLIIFFSIVIIFGWYYLATSGLLFNEGVSFVDRIIESSSTLMSAEYQSGKEAQLLLSPSFKNQFLAYIHYFVTWCVFLSIGFGLLYSVFNYKKFLKSVDFKSMQFRFLASKIEPELFFLATGCIGLLGAMLIFKVISEGYDSTRLFSMTTIILSLFLVIGIISASEIFCFLIHFLKVRVNQELVTVTLISGIVLLYYLFNLGVPYELAGNHQSLFNTNDKNFQINYVHDSEVFSGKWLNIFIEKTDMVFVPGYTRISLISGGRIPIDRVIMLEKAPFKAADTQYIFFGSQDLVDGYYVRRDVNSYSRLYLTEKQDKIYANNGAEVFMFR
jgi:uncharacterized membrane protein